MLSVLMKISPTRSTRAPLTCTSKLAYNLRTQAFTRNTRYPRYKIQRNAELKASATARPSEFNLIPAVAGVVGLCLAAGAEPWTIAALSVLIVINKPMGSTVVEEQEPKVGGECC